MCVCPWMVHGYPSTVTWASMNYSSYNYLDYMRLSMELLDNHAVTTDRGWQFEYVGHPWTIQGHTHIGCTSVRVSTDAQVTVDIQGHTYTVKK